MRKVISIAIILTLTAVYYCSNNPDIISAYTDFREKKPFIGSDKTGYGGLYGMCYLPEYRIPFSYSIKAAQPSSEKNIDLYVFCDSYLYYSTKESHFYGIDSLIKIKWWEIPTYRQISSLNKNKHNVLVIEMTERYVRDICTDYYGITNLLKIDSTYNSKLKEETVQDTFSFSDFLEKHFFNPNINSNLEMNLFDYPLFRSVKEFKAEFNYKVFNRVNNDVFVDTANKFLFYKPTLSGDQKMNSFYPLYSNELPLICQTLNKVYDYYKSKGFDEIYLALIPNPVTMVNPSLGTYNRLIPKINEMDSLRIQIFDIYSVFATEPAKYYSTNDTHWNSAGLQSWLDRMNELLKNISDKSDL